MIIVSACLLGIKCKYDGRSNFDHRISLLAEKEKLVPLCPEQLGGLATPRPKAEIKDGDGFAVLEGKAHVLSEHKEDVTSFFIKGANETLKAAKLLRARCAILKDGSPSCGVSFIYDGNFQKQPKEGKGVTAALLAQNGIKIWAEDKIEQILTLVEKRPLVAVVGGGKNQISEEVLYLAYEIGRLLALLGAVVLNGGKGGVMEAASKGCQDAGGISIGILPENTTDEANPYLSLALATGLGEARNALLTTVCEGVVALEGEYGTLSEIAFALKNKKPVVALQSWKFLRQDPALILADNPCEAVDLIYEAILKMRQ